MRALSFALAFLAAINVCSCSVPASPLERYEEAVRTLSRPDIDEYRFYALTDAAKGALTFGSDEEAASYARELLEIAGRFEDDWNYGNALHHGNLVLGRLSVRKGDIEEAKNFLSKAGNTPGSPQLNSFGPNMSLALDLLEKGESEAVLEYIQACRKFWKRGETQLSEWEDQIKQGRVPEFGYHLEL